MAWTCDICDHPPRPGERLRRIDLPHLVACKTLLCVECLDAVRGPEFEDIEEFGPEGTTEDQDE